MLIKKNKLNLACGKDIKEDYINLDWSKFDGVDVVHDVNKFPWPFKSDTFEEIYCSHILEHVDDMVQAMREIHRISKNGGKVIVFGPHFSCGVSYRDPTHKRTLSYCTFDYFTKECFYKGMPIFEIVERKLNFTRQNFTFLNYIFNPLININPVIYERFFCWMLPASEVQVQLEVKK